MSHYALYARKSQEDEGRQQQSIDDQIASMREVAQWQGVLIQITLTEEKSAKEPYQRPIFDQLIQKVQGGEIDSLLCYHVNRLARNMVEGGLLQHLLTKGQLKEIRTHTEVFRSGDNILPFILQAALHPAGGHVHAVQPRSLQHRAARPRLQGGEGRLPAARARRLRQQPLRAYHRGRSPCFPLIRKAWDLMLSGSYSLEQLTRVMNEQWGYTTRKARKIGGAPIGKSSLHRLFTSVFYTGFFLHNGELFEGSHPAMISFDEFEAVQKLLRRHGYTRPKTREFAFTGLIVCARCGRQVTAEHKRGGHRSGNYIYYHCANYRQCGGKAVRQEVLEAQIDAQLQSVAISPQYRSLALEVIERTYAEESAKDQAQYAQYHRALEEAQQRLSRLIKMAMRDMISEAEFALEKKEVQAEINTLKKASVQAETQLQRARDGALEVAKFVTSAPVEFRSGTTQHKREIAGKLGVVYRLHDDGLETELHPLLVPLSKRPTEPLKSGSESNKDGSVEPSVLLGRADGTMLEPLRQIWNLLVAGTPRF